MEKLGILGGMGPLCTAHFYEKIVKYTKANKDQDHIPTIILSDPQIPDRTSVILTGKEKDLLLEKAREDLKTLEQLSAKNIAIPCNTMHYFYDEFVKMTDVNIINMIYETIKYCKENKAKNIAVLGTRGTIDSGIYEKYADEFDINIIKLSEEEKDLIMETIYSIKKTNNTKKDEFIKMISDIKDHDVDRIIIACTELSLVEGIENLDYIVDAMDVLARKSIISMGYQLK